MAKRSSGLRLQPAGGTRASSLPVGKKQILSIERLAHDGRGIAHAEGRTWFVSGALAGEAVEARVLNARGKVVEARLERVLQASPERRQAPCRHYQRCGGCNLQHLPHDAQLALKQGELAADGLYGNIEACRRTSNAALLGDDPEIMQVLVIQLAHFLRKNRMVIQF